MEGRRADVAEEDRRADAAEEGRRAGVAEEAGRRSRKSLRRRPRPGQRSLLRPGPRHRRRCRNPEAAGERPVPASGCTSDPAGGPRPGRRSCSGLRPCLLHRMTPSLGRLQVLLDRNCQNPWARSRLCTPRCYCYIRCCSLRLHGEDKEHPFCLPCLLGP